MQNGRKDCQTMYSPEAIVADCKEMLAYAAGPRGWNDTRESWLQRAARAVGIDYSRAYNIFYGRSRRIEASEYLTIRHKVNELRARQAANREAMAHAHLTLSSLDSKSGADVFGMADAERPENS